jgi:hypothetical protein
MRVHGCECLAYACIDATMYVHLTEVHKLPNATDLLHALKGQNPFHVALFRSGGVFVLVLSQLIIRSLFGYWS